MTHTKDEALLKALEDIKNNAGNPEKVYQISSAAIKQALAAPVQPVATVIEELEHDGEGFCAKVRWLYNPVPVGETLSWEQPK